MPCTPCTVGARRGGETTKPRPFKREQCNGLHSGRGAGITTGRAQEPTDNRPARDA